MRLPTAAMAAIRGAVERAMAGGGTSSDVAQEVADALVAPDGSSPPWPPVRYRLPNDRRGTTARLVIHGERGTAAYSVTIGYYPDGKLGEMFVRQEREGGTPHGALLDALATVISIALQHGVPWEVFAEKLAHQRFEPSGLTEDAAEDLKMASSPVDYIARWVTKRAR